MPFTLVYHPSVAEEDVPLLPLKVHRRIARAIESRLVVRLRSPRGEAPEQHGMPLKGTLKGYWKLRVGDYRVVYKIAGTEVQILGVRHRKRIYEDLLRRISQRDR